MSICIENLSKVIKGKKILDSLSFSINENSSTGILGLNGAGKSSLMAILSGNALPSKGLIYIQNNNEKINLENYKSNIGYLSENNPLYMDMYVIEFLEFIAKIYRVPKNKIPSLTNEVLEKCKIQKKQFKIKQLSKGYRQRLGIAKTIIHNPKILILDEPTSGLDFVNILEIRTLIKEISQNKTLIISSHTKEDIEELCTKTILLSNGKMHMQ